MDSSQEMMATLHTVIDHLKQRHGLRQISLLDVPCGDHFWMNRFLDTRDDVLYTGMDIVPALIQHHQEKYPSKRYPRRRFLHGDIVHEEIGGGGDGGSDGGSDGEGKYHLILCRMMMQHLKSTDVMSVLHRISTSGAHAALLTTIATKVNMELNTAKSDRYRPLNLEIPPYMLSPPQCLMRELSPSRSIKDHFIGLWSLPLYQHKRCDNIHDNFVTNISMKLWSCAELVKPN